MKQVTKAFLIVSMIYSIVTALYLGIFAIVFLAGGATGIVTTIVNESSIKPEDAELVAQIVSIVSVVVGVCCLFAVAAEIVGAVLSKGGLEALESGQMTVTRGVLLIIFGFLPAGVLFLIYRSMAENSKARVV